MPERLKTLSYLRRILIIAILVIAFFQPVKMVQANVILIYFKGTPQPNGILLEWETSSETNNSGFYILRSTKPNMDFTRLNIFFLSDSETGEGVYYSYLDDQLIPDTTYYYELEVIALDGESEFFGPVAVSYLLRTPTLTSTVTPVQTSLGPVNTSTPTYGITTIPTKSPTPTRTTSILASITPTIAITPTPTISGTLSSEPTLTPTLEPLPTLEYLFPAITETIVVSSTPGSQRITTEQNFEPPFTPKPLPTRYILLLGIIFLLWAFLSVFLVLLMRIFYKSALFEEGD